MRFWLLLCLCAWGPHAQAEILAMPATARLMATQATPAARYDMPIGPWVQGAMAQRAVQGDLTRSAWRIDTGALTTAQIIAPLHAQLLAAGFRVVFGCQTAGCGGYDFRFATAVMPPPQMQVNLGDFHYLAAERQGAAITLLVSRTAQAGFVQVTQVMPPANPAQTARAPDTPQTMPPLLQDLFTQGRAVLPDLGFATGAEQPVSVDDGALRALADYLNAQPDARIALVGHSDTSGPLEGNITLSRQRAAAVRALLIGQYGARPAQISAHGLGFLAPLARNDTDAGRAANRRVEVVLTQGTVPPAAQP